MSDVEIAEDFVEAFGPRYKELLKIVVAACETTETRMPGIVYSVYTRGQSTPGGIETKEPSKIASKVRRKGLPVGIPAFLELTDIVGVTVVYQYPQQLNSVLNSIRDELSVREILVSEPEIHKNQSGYFATHIICSGDFGGTLLHCEVQTAKPCFTMHGPRKCMILLTSRREVWTPDWRRSWLPWQLQLRASEQQSQLIHDMIKASWNVEANTRRAARRQLFEVRVKYKDPVWLAGTNEVVSKLHERIEAMEKLLGEATLKDPQIRGLLADVDGCCRNPDYIRKGWILAARVASLRATPDLILFLITQADRWLSRAEDILRATSKRSIKKIIKEIGYVPTVFYICGDLDRAIDYCDRVYSKLDDERKTITKFNLVHFAIEREDHTPTLDDKGKACLRRNWRPFKTCRRCRRCLTKRPRWILEVC